MATVPLTDEQCREALQACSAYPTKTAAGGALNLTRGSFDNRIREALRRGMVMPAAIKPLAATAEIPAAPFSSEALRAALRKSPATLDDLATALKVTRGKVLDAVDELKSRGVNVCKFGDTYSVENEPTPQRATGGDLPSYLSRPDNTYLFGFTSDNHIGSKYERLDVVHDLYDQFAAQGVDRVFNAGNWIDGESRFNKHDIHTHGMDRQLDYFAREYPQRDGITTFAIAGDDHEGWYCQREGVDIGAYAEMKMRQMGREDFVNLGYIEAFVRLTNANSGEEAKLLNCHPGGGSAYAISYTSQKSVEAFEGGEKPAVALFGHYHKLMYAVIRNVHAIQTGCFTANTNITTKDGQKKIKDIAVGDLVLTHTGQYKPVTRLFKKKHTGGMVSLNYGRKGRCDQALTATPEHPVLVERPDGLREWVLISDVQAGDVIFVAGKDCPTTGERIPFWMNMSRNGNPMDRAETRDKLSATKGGRTLTRGGSAGQAHMVKDVLPFCDELRAQGWAIVPVGAGVIPDAIGFKDGKIVAFEVENSRGRLLDHKKAKYENAEISRYIDSVEWVEKYERKPMSNAWYEADAATGFCKVTVISVSHRDQYSPTRKSVTVYNFSVDGDESYVAGNVVVHNCTEDQTPFMRKKKLSAHVGGGIAKLTQDPVSGAITSCRVEFFNYFNKGFYNNRWSMSGNVILPDRGAPR